MWRPDPQEGKLTEQQAGELAALDRVLTGGPPGELDAGQRSLAALVAAVRADHPPLRPAFADELAARLGTGFSPAVAGSPGRLASSGRAAASVHHGLGTLRRGGGRRRLIGLGAGASVVAVSVVLVAGLGFPGDTRHVPGPVVSGGSTSGSAPAVGSAAQPSGTQSLAAPSAARAVQSDASLGLLAPHGRLQRVSADATSAIDRVGGIVESSSVVVDKQGASQATISARVPTADLERVLAALSSLADVTSRSQNTLDITDPTGVARQQLVESRAERSALLRQLAAASTPNQVASIRAQLGLAAGRIAQDEKDLQRLVDDARYATLNVAITESATATGAGAGSAWTPSGAVHDALRVLEAVFAVLVIALAGLVPVGVLGALVWWSARAVRRRRRRAALAA
jgi:hypothetical protein